jgi:hypothetical protein
MPKTESEAVATVAKARASFAAYKGHFTRALKTFDRQVALVLSTDPTAQAVTALDKAHETFLDRYDKACKALDGLIDASIAAGEADDHTDDERDALDDGYSKVEEVFMDAASRLSRGVRRAQAPAAAAVAPAAGGAAANVVREAKGLKPRDLLSSDTHVALREWLASFRIYYDASKFEHATDAMKHGYFYACMEKKLAFRVRSAATATSAVLNTPGDDPDPTSLETLLREQFDMQDSLFARRYRLMDNRHQPGTRFTDWMNQYTAESDECDLAAMTPDLFLAGQFTAKCADPELQKELMKTDGTLKAIRETAVAYERRSADLGTYKDKASSGSSGHISAIRGDCQRCGGTCPSGAKCPADDSSCMYCGKHGHWAGVCRKRQSDDNSGRRKSPDRGRSHGRQSDDNSGRRKSPDRGRSHSRKPKKTDYKKAKERGQSYTGRSDDSDSDGGASKGARPKRGGINTVQLVEEEAVDALPSVNVEEEAVHALPSVNTIVRGHSVRARNTPTLTVRVNGYERSIAALPDTGACLSIISPSWIGELDLWHKVDPAAPPKLSSATGNVMEVKGTIDLQLTVITKGKAAASTRVVFTVGIVKHGLIIGWEDLIRLGVIHPNFPEPLSGQCGPSPHCGPSPRCGTVSAVEKRPDIAQRLSAAYRSVFDESAIRTMKGPKMKIHLQDGYEPKRVLTARQTPVHLREGAEETLNAAIKSGVIVPVSEPTEWISPAFFVAKATPGKARLVTDYTALNRFVTRPVHPFPSPVDVMRLIKPESKVFAKLDAYSGYFQIPLEPESSLMTTFILPSGKYRYTRAPMGLNASSDEFCRRTDEALAGVAGVVKVVDDILVQAENYEQLEERLEQVLERCRAARITLTKGKFYVGEEVKFAGVVITGSGIKPDPGKIRAISDFPAPTNISALRSFLGLANQLGMFHTGLAAATNDLRCLLKKGVAWSWTPEIHNAFLRVKELLSSEACVRPFQTNRLAELITDASSIHGLGFALMQDGFLIQAGSRSLIDAETRYAVVELEATAVAWAVKQCRHYLLGCRNFKVWTDHRPLVGIFKKDMSSVDSRRLNRIRESLLGYNFDVEYLAGKDNVIADALSRFPVSAVTAEDVPEEDDDEFVDDPAIQAFAAATAADKDLQAVIGVVKARCPPSNLPPQHPARPFSSVLDELSISAAGILVLRGTRIVVPKTLRPQVVRALHAGHAGITKTLLHARQRYSWPHMANDIKTVIDACEACQEHRQGPHFEPEVKRIASYPMEAVSVDLMEVKGTKYLVMVDRFSSYPLVKVVRAATTSSIAKILSSWFNEFGWPKSIGSDGGPQFKEQFKEFCTSKKIVHELSSVRNPQSNGLAEAGVKRIKYLMEKCRTKEEFEAGLFAFRNAPMADGRPAPAVAFHGRELRDPDLPTVPPAASSPAALSSAAPSSTGSSTSSSAPAKKKKQVRFNAFDEVRIFDPDARRWNDSGTVVRPRAGHKSFFVMKSGGRVVLKNHRHLRHRFRRQKPPQCGPEASAET